MTSTRQGPPGQDESQSGDKRRSGDKPGTFCNYGGGKFQVSKTGVTFIGTDKNGEELPPQWICSTLYVKAQTRDTKSGEWGRLLEWQDDDRVVHRWAMPMELLQGDGCEVRRELARQGLSIAPGTQARDLLSSYLQVWPVKDRARCVERLGWHGTVYVTPSESIGKTNELVVFQNAHAVEPALSIAGTVADWQTQVARLAAGNSRLVFALSVSFAAPLAGIVGEDSGGFHLRGSSSSGKTTALGAAASVWDDPKYYKRLWRATANGLEGLRRCTTMVF
jgi:putative DNA primase/helicase